RSSDLGWPASMACAPAAWPRACRWAANWNTWTAAPCRTPSVPARRCPDGLAPLFPAGSGGKIARHWHACRRTPASLGAGQCHGSSRGPGKRSAPGAGLPANRGSPCACPWGNVLAGPCAGPARPRMRPSALSGLHGALHNRFPGGEGLCWVKLQRSTQTATWTMSDTIFGKIIRREIPATIVYEDDDILGFRDIAPQAPVHVLFIPKHEAIPTLDDARPEHAELFGRLMLA